MEYSGHWWECTVEIDDNIATVEMMKELILFWIGGKNRLKQNKGNVITTFLQQLAREIFYILTEHNYTEEGVIDEFDNREGWCKMDGSMGIKITYTDNVEISHDDFSVEEIV